MTKSDVLTLLKENTNERGLVHWEKLGDDRGGLESFGIGLTQLRKLAKQIGRDHNLALELWNTDNHDARIIGLLIDDPKQLTEEQAEAQVEEVAAGMLAHVFSSCDATLSKAPFAFELAQEWIKHSDPLRRQCGFGLVYELSKSKKNADVRDVFYMGCIETIASDIGKEPGPVRGSMGAALMGIGKRSADLNLAAVKVAKKIGPVDYGDDANCEPFDVLKHLTSDYLKKKLGI